MPRTLAFIVHPGFELLDLSGPCSAFHLAREQFGADYRIRVVSVTGGPVVDRAGVSIASDPFDAVGPCHTVLAAGGPTAHQFALDPTARALVRRHSETAARVGSVCTGAFLLAAAGLLDGRRATTHWRYAGLLQSHYPTVQVEVDRIFIRDGAVWTSAGMTAGMDLALAMIEDDLGTNVAQGVARDMVVHRRRLGGQSQFSALHDLAPDNPRIRDALQFAADHLAEDLNVDRLAQVACLSPRQFTRVFVHTTGTTPARAIERLRLEAARARIEDGHDSFAHIARSTGFGNVERLRRSCVALFGQPPQELRRAARQRE